MTVDVIELFTRLMSEYGVDAVHEAGGQISFSLVDHTLYWSASGAAVDEEQTIDALMIVQRVDLP